MRGTVKERLLRFREIQDGHWIFTGVQTSRGYGQLWVNGRMENVHRVAWTVWRGEIPKGWDVHHNTKRCNIKTCFRPSHLKAMSRRGHLRFHKAPGELCKRGHDLSNPENYTITNKGRSRRCKLCRKIRKD